jgi:hypothetical protein
VEERLEVLRALPPEEREQMKQALDDPESKEVSKPRKKPRRRRP